MEQSLKLFCFKEKKIAFLRKHSARIFFFHRVKLLGILLIFDSKENIACNRLARRNCDPSPPISVKSKAHFEYPMILYLHAFFVLRLDSILSNRELECIEFLFLEFVSNKNIAKEIS